LLKRNLLGLCACLMLAAAFSGCTPNKQQGTEDRGGNQAKYDTFGVNIRNDNAGTDKGPASMLGQRIMHNREPQLVAKLERFAEDLPGVADIKVLAYKDTILAGVLPVGTLNPGMVNTTPSTRYTPGAIVRNANGHTDHLQTKVVDRMRTQLTSYSRFNLLYVSTDRAIYDRILDLHTRIERGEPVSDDVFQTLINDIGYTVKGYNLTD